MKFVQLPPKRNLRDEYLEEQRAGRILPGREAQKAAAAAPDRSRMGYGWIPPKPVEERRSKKDEADMIPAAQAEVISGIIAATVSSNRVMPMAVNPSTWDVFACKFAILSGSLSAIRLPTPGIPLWKYAAGLQTAEFDDVELELDPPKQNLRNIRTSDDYGIEAKARCDQAGLTKLLEMADPNLEILELRWAGPWSPEERHFFTVTLEDHVIAGNRYTHTPTSGNVGVDVPPVDVVEAGDHALIDIQFVSMGGKWQAIMTRMR